MPTFMLWLILGACTEEPPTITLDPTPRVQTVQVQAPPSALTRTLLSTLEPARDAYVTPMRPGRVVERVVEPGDRVRAGDALLRLDAREARANLDAAQAQLREGQAVLDEARRQAERVQTLGDGASTAQQDQARTGVARAEAAVALAEAQAELARVALDHMTLRAPFDGEVALLAPQVGETVAAGSGPVARVVDTSSARVVVGLLEDEVSAAAAADATFEVSARGVRAAATLAHLSPAADPRTLAWRAELRVAEPTLPAGTPVQVVLSLPTSGAAGVLPPKAVRDGHVWRVDESTVRRAPVEVVGESRAGLLVTGVGVGDEVVLYAAEPLEEGAAIVRVEAP